MAIKEIKSICVFCGSNTGSSSVYSLAATTLGSYLAVHKIRLVFGGGQVGLMGKLANAVIKGGGDVIGVMPKVLFGRELGQAEGSELIVTNSMHERKLKMYSLADAFLVLPGGIGTMEEVFETLTWRQLGIHRKPIGLLNVNNFYDHFLKLLRVMEKESFLKQINTGLLYVDKDIHKLVTRLKFDKSIWQNYS